MICYLSQVFRLLYSLFFLCIYSFVDFYSFKYIIIVTILNKLQTIVMKAVVSTVLTTATGVSLQYITAGRLLYNTSGCGRSAVQEFDSFYHTRVHVCHSRREFVTHTWSQVITKQQHSHGSTRRSRCDLTSVCR